MSFGNGVNIMNDDNIVLLINQVSGSGAGDDLAKNTVSHIEKMLQYACLNF